MVFGPIKDPFINATVFQPPISRNPFWKSTQSHPLDLSTLPHRALPASSPIQPHPTPLSHKAVSSPPAAHYTIACTKRRTKCDMACITISLIASSLHRSIAQTLSYIIRHTTHHTFYAPSPNLLLNRTMPRHVYHSDPLHIPRTIYSHIHRHKLVLHEHTHMRKLAYCFKTIIHHTSV